MPVQRTTNKGSNVNAPKTNVSDIIPSASPVNDVPAPVPTPTPDAPNDVAPTPEPTPEPAKPPTPEETLRELKEKWHDDERKYQDALETDELPELEINKLADIAYASRMTYRKQKAKIEADKQAKEREIKIVEHVSIVDTLLNAYYLNRQFMESLPPVEAERTKEQIDQSNVLNTQFTDLYEQVKGEVRKTFTDKQKEQHIPMGMTGKQLQAKTNGATDTDKAEGKKEFYKRLLGEGMTKQQIMDAYPESIDAKGGANGTLRTAVGEFNAANK